MHKLLFFCHIHSTIIINHIIIIQNGLWLKVYTNWHLAANPVHHDLVNASFKHWKLYNFYLEYIEINNK